MKTKAFIILLICVMLLSACGRVKNNNSKTPDIVPETASFYEGHKIVLADEYKNEKKYLYSYISPKCYLDEYIAVYISAEKASSNSGSTEENINVYNTVATATDYDSTDWSSTNFTFDDTKLDIIF